MVMIRRIQRSDFGVEFRAVVNISNLLLELRRVQRILANAMEGDPKDAFPVEAFGPIPFASLGKGVRNQS